MFICKFPKTIAGRTNRTRGTHVARVFETPNLGLLGSLLQV